MKLITGLLMLFFYLGTSAQTLTQRLAKAWSVFERDEQLKHAIAGFEVVDAETGKPLFSRNAALGLAPASTQKIVTAVFALEKLGPAFRFSTDLRGRGALTEGVWVGDLYLRGSGDPSLGSNRWPVTQPAQLFEQWYQALRRAGIRSVKGRLSVAPGNYSAQAIPDGWIWQDIGNYYGAGSFVLNWKENQRTLKLQPGKQVGDRVLLLEGDTAYCNELRTAASGSGDNAYAYLPIGQNKPVLRGTIPLGSLPFPISVADYDPGQTLIAEFTAYLAGKGIAIEGEAGLSPIGSPVPDILIYQHLSPPLDSLIYFFLRKSINLYGEALVKQLAVDAGASGDTEAGIRAMEQFFKARGFDTGGLRCTDGSGLSPQNRVSAAAMVHVLQYARSREWFPQFYRALPEYNGMKMKSGSINAVRAFAGYQRAASGKTYGFSIIVNNYEGPAAQLIKKIYKLLDLLK